MLYNNNNYRRDVNKPENELNQFQTVINDLNPITSTAKPHYSQPQQTHFTEKHKSSPANY